MDEQSEGRAARYEEPVAALLGIGEVSGGEWADYGATYGLTAGDVPELVRMVQDEELHDPDQDGTEIWAPIHAWRALAQLGAEEAVEGLLGAFWMTEEGHEWMMEEMPEVFGRIGPGALPALTAFLADPEQGMRAKTTASNAVVAIVRRHPAVRAEGVEILASQLAHYETQDSGLNASLVSDLAELKALEAQEVMAAAFAADKVDLSVMGDWEEVQIELGLLEERLTPKPEKGWNPALHDLTETLQRVAGQYLARQRIEEEALRRQWGKVKRNDPCPCGSGKKYKRCHGRPG